MKIYGSDVISVNTEEIGNTINNTSTFGLIFYLILVIICIVLTLYVSFSFLKDEFYLGTILCLLGTLLLFSSIFYSIIESKQTNQESKMHIKNTYTIQINENTDLEAIIKNYDIVEGSNIDNKILIIKSK